MAPSRPTDHGLGEEHLLLDPHVGVEDGGEQIGAGGAGGIASDAGDESLPLVIGERAATRSIAVEGGDVHGDGGDGAEGAFGEAAQDEHARAIEVAGVRDGDAGAAHLAEKFHHRPARLATREHHELVACVADRVHIIEERGLVLDDEGAAHGELEDARVAQLGEGQGHHIAQGGVGGDVIEAASAFAVHHRTKAVDREGALVAVDAAHLEREPARLAWGHLAAADVDGLHRLGMVIEERDGDAAQAVTADGQGLAVAQHGRGEVGQANGRVVGDGSIHAPGDALALVDGVARVAASGEKIGVSRGGGNRGDLRVEERAGGVGAAGASGVGQAALNPGAQGVVVGGGVAGRALEGGVEQGVEINGELVATHALGPSDVEEDAAAVSRTDRAGREELGERVGLGGTGGDGDGAGQGAAALAAIEKLAEDGGEPGGRATQPTHVGDDGGVGERRGGRHAGHGSHGSRAHRLIGRDREAAFEDGCAPALLDALQGNIGGVLAAERAPYYINLLYALVLMRRGHELEPRHEDLYARVARPQSLLGDYDLGRFATDVDQLVTWDVVERITEARRLRGYKDNRLVQYRYRVTDDAIAAIEWLEARLARSLEGRARDSRDLLADVIGALKEARRVLDGWRKGARGAEPARRAYYLMESAADTVGAISEELLTFRAEMMLFSQRPYDITALREILRWLERYVSVYLRRVLELRGEILDRVRQLAAPRYRKALAECRAELERERRAAPSLVRAVGPLRDEELLLELTERFFCHDGRLADLCRHIDGSARQVLLKMHRHIRELERRSARLDDLRSTISALARMPNVDDERYGGYLNHVVASAHGLFDRRSGTMGHRVAPPVPRKHQLSGERRASRCALTAKQTGASEARVLRAKALAALSSWLHDEVLAGRSKARWSEARLTAAVAPRRVMDVARARHLGGGKALRALEVRIEDAKGQTLVGHEDSGQLRAPDAAITSTRRRPSGRKNQ